MPRTRIHNFHNARLSVVQSCIREIICKKLSNAPGSGLCATHRVMRAAGIVLNRIDQGALTNANAAVESYKVMRAVMKAQSVSTVRPGREAGTTGPAQNCLDLLVQYAIAWVFHNSGKMRQIESEFRDNACDPGWLTAMIHWLEYYWAGQAPQYVPPTSSGPQPIPLPPPASADGQLRVGILGDWGTGETEALVVLDQLMQQHPDLIIHV